MTPEGLLLVEDNEQMATLLRQGLEREGYTVLCAFDGATGLALARTEAPTVMVLDVMLPALDGYEVAGRLRREQIDVPILMLTARDAPADIVRGLDRGADDYLTKPFAFDVLLARLRAISRRASGTSWSLLRVGDLALDPDRRAVSRQGRSIELTKTEFDLLECLMRRAGRIVPRDVLLETVWGRDRDIASNTLDAFVRLVRRKVDGPDEPRLIHTARGVGFCVRTEPPE